MLTKLNDSEDVVIRLDCGNKNKTNYERKLDGRNLSESNQLIEFISNQKCLSKKDQCILNRKRVTQIFDLFNSKYDCRKCRKKLRYKAEQIIHEKLKHNHQIVKQFNRIKCPYCAEIFSSYFKLRYHVMIDHLNERPYSCRVCNKKFHAFILLKRHCIKKHLNVSSSSSSTLSYSSSESPSSSTNESLKQNSDLFDLIDYENSLINQPNLIKTRILPSSIESNLSINSTYNQKIFHLIKKKKINKSIISSVLDYTEVTKQKNVNKSKINLIRSLKKIEEMNFSDQNKSNEKKEPINQIFTIITQLNVINCNICMKVFKTNSEYILHYWQIHLCSNNNSKLFCWHCMEENKTNIDNFNFTKETDLLNHLQIKHLKELCFKCSICKNAYFSNLSDIKNHLTNNHCRDSLNRNKFVYACSSCEQIYHDFDSIQVHFEKNSKCNLNNFLSPVKLCCIYCNENFSNEITFKIHLTQHKFFNLNNQTFNDFLLKNTNSVLNKKTPIFIKKNIDTVKMPFNSLPIESNSSHRVNKNILSYSIDSIVGNNLKLEEIDQTNLPIDYSTKTLSSHKQMSNNPKNLVNNSIQVPTTSSLSSSILSSADNSFMIPCNSTTNEKNSKIFENFNFWQSYHHQQQTNFNSEFLHKFSNLQCFMQNNFKTPNPSLFMMPSVVSSPVKIPILSTKVLSTNSSVSNQVFNSNFKCDLCGYSFKALIELNQHKQTHLGSNSKRPFKCHLCQVTFAKADQLIRHMIVHQASELDSVCQICYSSFSRKQDLDRHMLFHSK